MHGLGASLRQMLRFARPWERVVLGVVLFVVATLLRSYVLAALGVVIVGVTVVSAARTRRGPSPTDDSEAEADSGVAESP